MDDLFENAVDSLILGISFYLVDEFETAHKHAILNIYQSIELFLKVRLFRINPLFIYKNIDKPISDDSLTVGLEEIFARYKNLGMSLDEKECGILINLRKARNVIEHHKYVKDDGHFFIIGKSLRFLYNFLPDHLDSSMEDILDDKMYRQTREVVLKYEERLDEALEIVKEMTTPRSKDDLCDPTYSAYCPSCGNRTVVIGTEKGDYCFFCLEDVVMDQCEWCGEYFDQSEVRNGMCGTCEEERFRRF